jgi:hypothetical protein
MKTVLTLILVVVGLQCFAENNFLCIKDPNNTGSQGAGNLSNVNIEVTPKGIYAQVDLTFSISDPSGYPGQWEGVLYFDLPEGSYIHDSWLWLNDTNIITADIVERDRAIQTYNGIVHRKRDPSLLLKNLTSHYRLNVYPIRNDYARKVKITYSTPFVWRNGMAAIVLPTALLGSSRVAPAFTLRVNTDSVFNMPSFEGISFPSFTIAQSAASYMLNIPSGAYRDSRYLVSDLLLVYNANTSGNALVYTYPTSAYEGVYQYVVPAAITGGSAPRSVLYIIDQYGSPQQQKYNMARSMPEIIRFIRNSLLRDLKPTDSFNVFYSNGTSFVKASPTWRAADSAGIDVVINSITFYNNTQGSQLRNLLWAALPYAKSKPNAQCVLFGCDPTYNASNRADTMFTSLEAFISGFTNRIDVVNNSMYTYSIVGSEYFYTKLCLATGGAQYKSKGIYYDGYTANYSSDLDIDACLRQICQYPSQSTTAYNVVLPLNGIAYSDYEPAIAGKYNPAIPFAQSGRYYGTWPSNGNIQVKYVSSGVLHTSTTPVAGTRPGSANAYQGWLYNYMNELKSLNLGGSAKAESVDSSIKNRVLYDYTAFLALEAGDTLKTNVDAIALAVPKQLAHERWVNVFPNPFAESITIRCQEEIAWIQITDIFGRVIWESKSLSGKQLVWSGKNMSGVTVSPGIYLISVGDKFDNRFTVKVEKQ